MKQNSLEKLLQQDAPPPNPAARVAARRAALEEFARQHATSAPARRGLVQGLLGALRLSRNDTHGRNDMPWYSRRLVIGGAASVFIAMFGVTLVWNAYEQDPRIAAIPGAAETARAPTELAQRELPQGEPAPADVPVQAAGDQPVSIAAPVEADAQALVAQSEAGRDGSRKTSQQLPDLAREQERLETNRQNAESAPVEAPPAPDATAEPSNVAQGPVSPPPPETTATIISSIAAEDLGAQALGNGSKNEKRAPSDSLEEVVIASSDRSRARPGHKSVAPPARTGGSLGDLFSRAAKPAEPAPPTAPLPSRVEGRDKFEHFDVNSVKQVADDPVSTFSADVDTSSYSFVRKQLDQGVLPQKDAVRAEEMINYFDYSWPAAEDRERPFRPTIAVSDSPWGKSRKLVHIGIKGYELPATQRPDANLVMLLDVSGSMDSPDKLPLVQQSMKLLLGSLKPTDLVSIVVYAGAAGQVLPPTPVGEKDKIIAALDSLSPGGSTAGAQGIELAYQLAERNFRKQGVNRILLCTDGDFNVGIAGTGELTGFVERKRETGIFLSVLGFGQGNYRDELAQALAQNGNGVAAYIDSLSEARKVLVQEAGSSLFTIAKDVKLQVEFNPATVAEYRLVGYETRALKREDFNNDAIDAGDIGAGHTVTAIYEITPVGVEARMVDESRYAKRKPVVAEGSAREYGYLKIRYKLPGESRSRLIEQPIGLGGNQTGAAVQRDVEFSTAVAGFAQLLRGGQFTGTLTYDDVIKAALASRGDDPYGYRNEFVQLVRKAQTARGM
jgi:Ca-activated chloride channel family protein